MKKPIILSLSLLAALSLGAEVISPAQALERISSSTKLHRVAAQGPQKSPRLVKQIDALGLPALYLFERNSNLLILSAESQAEALVGITDNYTPDAQLPPALSYMLDCYAEEIAGLRNDGDYVGATTRTADFAPIEPICKTAWNQGAPYNDMCPKIPDSDGRYVTGCVGTAMAQVLKTYEYPERTSGGKFTYNWRFAEQDLTIDFDTIAFNWAAMKDSHSEGDTDPAVALLMKAVGYAGSMNWTDGGSATYGRNMAVGMVRNFGFGNTLTYQERNWYTHAEWEEMIYGELAGGHAVYYDGVSADNASAHAFVVDGYLSDRLFHINWGWGGLSNGYFLLSALDPAQQGIGGSTKGYSTTQGAIFGLTPATENSEAPLLYCTNGTFKAGTTSTKLGMSVKFSGGLSNVGVTSNPSVFAAIKIVNLETGEITYAASTTEQTDVDLFGGVGEWQVKLPKELASGKYTVHPAVKDGVSGKFFDSKVLIGGDGYIEMTVDDNKVKIKNRKRGLLTTLSLSMPEEVYPKAPFFVKTSVENQSDDIYHGSIFVRYFKNGTTNALGCIGAFLADLEPGEKMSDVDVSAQMPEDVANGEYYIEMFDNRGRSICEQLPFTVADRPANGSLHCSKITVVNTAQNRLTFSFDVSGIGGIYTDKVYAVITPATNAYEYLYWFAAPATTIYDGKTTTVTATANWEDGTPNRNYCVYAFFINEYGSLVQIPGSGYKRFRMTPPDQSAIHEVAAPVVDTAEYYDLSGRRVTSPAKGIYIRRQGNKVSKVAL